MNHFTEYDRKEQLRLKDAYEKLAIERNAFRERLRLSNCPAQQIVGNQALIAFELNLADLRADWQVLENKRLASIRNEPKKVYSGIINNSGAAHDYGNKTFNTD